MIRKIDKEKQAWLEMFEESEAYDASMGYDEVEFDKELLEMERELDSSRTTFTVEGTKGDEITDNLITELLDESALLSEANGFEFDLEKYVTRTKKDARGNEDIIMDMEQVVNDMMVNYYDLLDSNMGSFLADIGVPRRANGQFDSQGFLEGINWSLQQIRGGD